MFVARTVAAGQTISTSFNPISGYRTDTVPSQTEQAWPAGNFQGLRRPTFEDAQVFQSWEALDGPNPCLASRAGALTAGI